MTLRVIIHSCLTIALHAASDSALGLWPQTRATTAEDSVVSTFSVFFFCAFTLYLSYSIQQYSHDLTVSSVLILH